MSAPTPELVVDAPGLSVVVPVYKGEETIGVLVEKLSALRPEGGLEIILVNDGSPDESGRVCRQLLDTASVPITLVEHARNFGEHNAVMTGLRHARGSFVITMDDDLQNPPEEVTNLYDYARKGNWDVVYARYALKKHEGWRNVGSRFANAVADLLLDKPKGLYLSTFRCMSAFLVRAITKYNGAYPYIDGLVMQVTDKIASIEVVHESRMTGRSTYTIPKLFGLWLNMVSGFSLVPLRLATLAGAMMSIIGAVCACTIIVHAVLRNDTPSALGATMTLILLVGGAQSMMLGIIGEYVGRTFLSSGGKPQAVVRSVEISAWIRSDSGSEAAAR
jgi:glycosyltransferase involved in cell wall biosynthesis